MSDPTPIPDIHDGPLPDLGHESLRLSVVAALDDLSTKTTQMAGALLLVRTAFNFAETMLSAVVPLQQIVTALAAANPRTVTDGATTAASATVTSASALFAVYDVGRSIVGGSLPDGTTVAEVTDAQTVTVSQAATADGTGLNLTIG